MKIIGYMVPERWSATDRICCHFGPFLPFNPTNNLKKQNLKKWKKCLGISSFYTYIPQMKIIWCMVTEIWCTTDYFFCHFGSFFALLPSYEPKKSKFWKNEKKKNHNHKLYCSWDMVHDRCNSKLCMLTPLTAWKIKILKKWNNQLEISSFYTCVPNIMTTW